MDVLFRERLVGVTFLRLLFNLMLVVITSVRDCLWEVMWRGLVWDCIEGCIEEIWMVNLERKSGWSIWMVNLDGQFGGSIWRGLGGGLIPPSPPPCALFGPPRLSSLAKEIPYAQAVAGGLPSMLSALVGLCG